MIIKNLVETVMCVILNGVIQYNYLIYKGEEALKSQPLIGQTYNRKFIIKSVNCEFVNT